MTFVMCTHVAKASSAQEAEGEVTSFHGAAAAVFAVAATGCEAHLMHDRV